MICTAAAAWKDTQVIDLEEPWRFRPCPRQALDCREGFLATLERRQSVSSPARSIYRTPCGTKSNSTPDRCVKLVLDGNVTRALTYRPVRRCGHSPIAFIATAV